MQFFSTDKKGESTKARKHKASGKFHYLGREAGRAPVGTLQPGGARELASSSLHGKGWQSFNKDWSASFTLVFVGSKII